MATVDFPTADTSDGKVHAKTLADQVTADDAIDTELSMDRPIEEVEVGGVPKVRYSFVSTLPAPEQTQLEDVVHANHIGNPPAPLTEHAHHTVASAASDVPPDAHEGVTIYVTDDIGGKTLAISDGVDWFRLKGTYQVISVT